MFPTLTTQNPPRRSLRELVRGAVGTALEFATLGEATLGSAVLADGPASPPVVRMPAESTAPTAAHPHRRQVARQSRRHRTGSVPARAQVCRTPVHHPAPRRT